MSRPIAIVMDWGVDTAPGSPERCFAPRQAVPVQIEEVEIVNPDDWQIRSVRVGTFELLIAAIGAAALPCLARTVIKVGEDFSIAFVALRRPGRFRALVRARTIEERSPAPLPVFPMPSIPGFPCTGPRVPLRWLLVWSCEDFETFEGLSVVRSDQRAQLDGLIVLATFDQEAPALAAVEGGIAFAPGLDTAARAWMVAALLGAELDALAGNPPRSRVHHEPVRRALGLLPAALPVAAVLPMNNPRESDR